MYARGVSPRAAQVRCHQRNIDRHGDTVKPKQALRYRAQEEVLPEQAAVQALPGRGSRRAQGRVEGDLRQSCRRSINVCAAGPVAIAYRLTVRPVEGCRASAEWLRLEASGFPYL
jgi:hypothetical protein